MTDSIKNTSNILFVVQRLSDFVEMQRAAKSLKNFGHRCSILFCGVNSKIHDDLVIDQIDKLLEANEIDEKIIFSEPKIIIKTPIHKFVDYLLQKRAKKFQKFIDNNPVDNGEAEILAAVVKKNTLSQGKFLPLKMSWLRKTFSWLRSLSNFGFNLLRIVRYRLKKTLGFIAKPVMSLCKNWFISLHKLTNSSLLVVPLGYKKNLYAFKEILKRHQIKLIILPEDIVGKVSPLLIKAGRSYGIPSMILPYTIANQTEAFQALKNRPEYSLKGEYSNRLLGFLFRSWVMKDASHAVLRLPAGHLLGHVLTRSSPPDPWMMNSTHANVIAVENEQMFNYYRQNGIPAAKMKVTGACYDDNLAGFLLDKTKQREKLYIELNIKSHKPFLLVGGFPNQLAGGSPPGFDFANAEEAVDFIVDCLDIFRADYEIIFRPHPNYLELGAIFAKKNFLVTHIDTARLVALSDIYIAFASATIRWAISCGVPTINYDIFYYDFADYKHVRGVFNVCSKADFKNAAISLSQQEQLTSVKNHLETEKLEWGRLDGQSGHRINLLAQTLILRKKFRRKAS